MHPFRFGTSQGLSPKHRSGVSSEARSFWVEKQRRQKYSYSATAQYFFLRSTKSRVRFVMQCTTDVGLEKSVRVFSLATEVFGYYDPCCDPQRKLLCDGYLCFSWPLTPGANSTNEFAKKKSSGHDLESFWLDLSPNPHVSWEQ